MFFLLTLVIGLVTGVLIGLTGMGGGALLMPAIIFLLNVPPTAAVGTSLVASGFSKMFATMLHQRSGNVNRNLVFHLLIGSVPGTFIGATALEALKVNHPKEAETVMLLVTGIILMVVPLINVIRFLLGRFFHAGANRILRARSEHGGMIMSIGFIGGVLVGFTSVGSGTIIISLLMFFFSMPAGKLVGTDVTHGMVITLFASIVHVFFGNVLYDVSVMLLVGLLPGTYVGVLLCTKIPGRVVKIVLTLFLILVGGWILIGSPGEFF